MQAEELREENEQQQSDLNAWAEWHQVDQTEVEEAAASQPALRTSFNRSTSYPCSCSVLSWQPLGTTRERMSNPTLAMEGSCPATLLWGQVVQIARQQHRNWLLPTPAQRASQLDCYHRPSVGGHNASRVAHASVARQSKLNISGHAEGNHHCAGLFFMILQTHLPSEPSARVDGLATKNAPLRPARTFKDALATSRAWRQQVLTVVTDVGGNPEPLQRFTTLKT